MKAASYLKVAGFKLKRLSTDVNEEWSRHNYKNHLKVSYRTPDFAQRY